MKLVNIAECRATPAAIDPSSRLHPKAGHARPVLSAGILIRTCLRNQRGCMSAGETVEMSSAGATLTKSVFVALRGRANALRQAVPGEGIEFRSGSDEAAG